jgi:alpha-glucosidase
MTSAPEAPWWKSAVVYQIYPRSFCDASGDGVGDLDGIRRHLDHLVWLGVDAIWISPFFRSPMKDYGYDVSDYCDVDPLFGTLGSFDRLLADAHERGLRVLIDWVPNHTSDQHPWFLEARASRTSPKRSWYVWRDGTPDTPPNNWRAAFTQGPAWSWDEKTGQWYLHLFLPEQPDLNWDEPEVEAAMHETLRFWLERGVDGFRMDVVHCIGKDPALPNVVPERAKIPYCALNEHGSTHERLRRIRKLLDSSPGQPVMVGEVAVPWTDVVARHYGQGDELHLAFNFPPLFAPWDAAKWRICIDRARSELDPRDAWPTWVLSNHDNPRHRTRYGSESRARSAAVLLLGLRGTPFLYAGEELGLEDAVIPPGRMLDPGGRDGCRTPLPWDATPGHGWGEHAPWLSWPPNAETRNVAALREDPGSILQLYRRLLRARRDSPALKLGGFRWLPSPDGVLVWERSLGSDRRVVALNFGGFSARVPLEPGLHVEIASDGHGENGPYRGQLGGEQGMVLRPSAAPA